MTTETLFAPAFGNRPSHLVGREGLLSQIDQGLATRPGSRDRALVMLGQRGMGKTVLLWEVADRAREQGYVVATPTVVTDAMLERVVEKIQDDGERYAHADAPTVSGGSVSALGFSVGLEFSREVRETKSASYRLTQLVRRLSGMGHGTIILVDEIQANSPQVRDLVVAYQEIVGEGLDVALVMAGLPRSVSATLNDRVLTFLNRATRIELEPLRIGDVEAFFAHAFDEMGMAVSPDVRRTAAQATEGSPYLMQLVGHYLSVMADSDGMVGEDALGEALRMAQDDFERDVCQTTLAALSEKDVEFLTAMSADDGPSKMSELAGRMGVTPDYAQKYRKRLLDAGVIEVASRGHVDFAVPYLRSYLRRG